jgi:transcriptional regulator with XRE-family HTH domain
MLREFGILVEHYRQECDESISQTQLAERVGVNQGYLSRVINGRVKTHVDPEVVYALGESLNIPVNRRLEFYLYATGHDPEVVQVTLRGSGLPEMDFDELAKNSQRRVVSNFSRRLA